MQVKTHGFRTTVPPIFRNPDFQPKYQFAFENRRRRQKPMRTTGSVTISPEQLAIIAEALEKITKFISPVVMPEALTKLELHIKKNGQLSVSVSVNLLNEVINATATQLPNGDYTLQLGNICREILRNR